jgi:hypothetical protein
MQCTLPLDTLRGLLAPQSNVKRPVAIYIEARLLFFHGLRKSIGEAGRSWYCYGSERIPSDKTNEN